MYIHEQFPTQNIPQLQIIITNDNNYYSKLTQTYLKIFKIYLQLRGKNVHTWECRIIRLAYKVRSGSSNGHQFRTILSRSKRK